MRSVSLSAHVTRLALVAGLLMAAPGASAAVQVDLPEAPYDGQANPIVHAWESGSTSYAWSVCDPEGTCGPTVSTTSTYAAGPTPAGSTFEVTATTNGLVSKARTRVWKGPLRSAAAPTLSGTAAVGSTVSATRGTWEGGWGGDGARAGVRACPTPAGNGCVDMTGHLELATFGAADQVRIGAVYEGWYVGAAHLFWAPTPPPHVFLPADPNAISGFGLPDASPFLSFGPLTRIAPAPAVEGEILRRPESGAVTVPGAAPAVQGPSPAAHVPTLPSVAFRSRAAKRNAKGRPDRLELGSLTCGSSACRAVVVVRQGARKHTLVLRAAAGAEKPIALLASRAPGSGRLSVQVTVDGASKPFTASVKRR